MSIELHCSKCSKLIKAPDNAGGRHGKCPYCDNSVYVPLPESEAEEIALAPVDEEEDREAEELRRESTRFAATIDHATDAKKGAGGVAKIRPTETPGKVIEVAAEVERFVLAMHSSKLDQAESAVSMLKKAGTRARDYVQGLMQDEIPPEFGNVPPPLIQGFLKALSGRL